MFKSLTTALTLVASLASAGTATKVDNVITLSGDVDYSMYFQFEKLYDNNVDHITMKSPGGYVKYGMKIVDIMTPRKDEIFTEATGKCASMCAVIWLAAENHVQNNNGKVGFHLSYISSRSYWENITWESGFDGVQKVLKVNVLEDMIVYFDLIDNRANLGDFMTGLIEFGTLPSDMWWPTNKELVSFEGPWGYLPLTDAELDE